MALVTVQRSPSPTNTPDSEEGGEGDDLDGSNAKSPGRPRSFSESYFAVKGAALILPQSDSECTYSVTKKISRNSNEGDIQTHLQCMIYLLRPQDTIKVAVKLESFNPDRNRYMAVVSTNGKQDTEESVILGLDCDETATIGLVIPIYANTTIKLDGDGGFQVVAEGHPHGFKPVSVQAMWSVLQCLNKVLKIATDNMYLARGLTHTWVGYYKSKINSERAYISEWNTNEDIEFFRLVPIVLETDDEEAALKKKIRVELKNVMMKVDLDDVTPRFLREQVEENMGQNLKEYKGYIDHEMLQILGQMDSPTLIKDFLYLGSEWNASNMEELQRNGVGHILNISKEIDNFFPTAFTYMNVREWDAEESILWPHWEHTYKFIAEARANESKVLVHCKMGISRSASTVIAFIMKDENINRQEAYEYVRSLRSCIMPNASFWKQLEFYEGILSASNQRHIFKVRSEQTLEKSLRRSTSDIPEESGAFLGQNLPLFDYHHMCHSATDLDESVFWHPEKRSDEDNNDACPLEPDFEISSRSADSTEEFLPDNLSPTPDTAAGMLKTASGVYYFQDPIITEIESDNQGVGGACKGGKVEDSSDSIVDKHLLNPDFAKETSSTEVPSQTVPKIKPDSSWIRESSTDDLDPGDIEKDPEMSAIDITDNAVLGENIVEGAIYFEAPPEDSDKIDASNNSASDSVFLQDATATDSSTDDGQLGIDQYIKENIPWNPGKVKKQKEDLERGKLKDSKSESAEDPDSVLILVEGQPYIDENLAGSGQSSDKQSMNISDKKDELMEDSSMDKGDNSSPLVDVRSESDNVSLKRPASVYELEDIQLPEGIVKRTTQEIEDRNRSTDDLTASPHKPLQRSSSFKDQRVTPKNKRFSERRKTCTPILSPRSPSCDSPSLSKEISKSELESSFTRDTTQQPMKSHDIDNTQHICDSSNSDSAKGDNLDIESPPTDVEVYKFLGEEVPVEKGIVKKQRMDIEQKHKERKDSDSKDSATTTPTVETKSISSTSPITLTDSEIQSALQLESKEPKTYTDVKTPPDSKVLADKNSTTKTPQVEKSDISSGDARQSQKVLSEEKVDEHDSGKEPLKKIAKSGESIGTESSNGSPEMGEKSACSTQQMTPTFSRKKKKESRQEGRFDAETLELIREIGSALLNSPAKSEHDDDEQVGEEGVGLVKRFVRNIEKQTRTVKKRSKREVVIVDKDSQKKKQWRFSTPESHDSCLVSSHSTDIMSKSAPGLVPNYDMSHSPSTPVLHSSDRKSFEHDSDSHSNTVHDQKSKVPDKNSATKLSPLQSNSSNKSPDSHAFDTPKSQSVIGSTQEKTTAENSSKEQTEEEVKGVKTLVGKFESSDKASARLSLLSPDEETKHILSDKSPLEIEIVTSSSPESSRSADKFLHLGHHVPSKSDDQSSWEDVTSDSSTEGTAHLQQLRQNLRRTSAGSRPRSADLFRSSTVPGYYQGYHRHHPSDMRRAKFQHARTLSENVDSDPPFTWEGKKIRKIHGKSHPLTKLESKRKSPFYNTM